jgi:uncharacterized protein (TIGR02246 family)
MNSEARAEVERIANSMTDAWNAGDAAAFARCFTTNSDFVNIFAWHVIGREAVAKQHQFIFESIYRGSRNAFSVVDVRELAANVTLAHIAADLTVPAGPLTGNVRTLASAVFVRDDVGWLIKSFHNTREQEPPGPGE